jgi:hypothetical protein
MSNLPFPIGTWGIVTSAEIGSGQIEKVRIDRGVPSGFIIVTKEPAGTFDVWVETEAEVVEFLETIAICWEQ